MEKQTVQQGPRCQAEGWGTEDGGVHSQVPSLIFGRGRGGGGGLCNDRHMEGFMDVR